MCQSSHTPPCPCNEIGTILGTVPDSKCLWLQTCFPYCHYWSYCSGLITSWLCQPFQRELNHAPPPPPHTYFSHFHPPLPTLCSSNNLLMTLELKDKRKKKKVNCSHCCSLSLALSAQFYWTKYINVLIIDPIDQFLLQQTFKTIKHVTMDNKFSWAPTDSRLYLLFQQF